MSLFLKNSLLFILLVLPVLQVPGQDPVKVERSTNKIILEGKVYYVHVVEPGQTLYSISRAYNLNEKDIALENPGSMSGIRVGQTLKIPVESTMAREVDTSVDRVPDEDERTHRVRKGETFYGIARYYGLSEKQLREANPGVDPTAFRPGMRLLIPEPEVEEAAQPVYNEEGYVYHRVKRKETLYSIGHFYGVSVEDIRKANPELGWGGPKAGQFLRIPLPQALEQAQEMPDTTERDYGLYGPADTLEAYDYGELSDRHDNLRRTYRIAYLVPFNFQEPEPLDSLLKDVESVNRRRRITERYHMEQKVPQSIPFLEFFQGSLLALDTMQETGMKLDVQFFDTRRSLDRTREILGDPWMEDADLIIGPFYSFNLGLVAEFGKQHRIPVVTPFYNEPDYTWDNPWLFQVTPSLEAEYREMAKLVASYYDYNIVYVREEDSLDTDKNNFLKEQIFDGFDRYHPENPVIFKEIVLTLQQSDEIIHSLSSARKNLVVVPTSNEALASRVVSNLYYRLGEYEIEVLGTPYWSEFSSINYLFYHKLGLMFCSPFWLDHLDPGIDHFLRNFRDHFYSEPVSMSRKGLNYGIAGFDITLYFVNALRVYGPRFILKLDEYDPKLVLDGYKF